MTRRRALQGALGVAGTAALASGAAAVADRASAPATMPLAFDDPIWNREMRARLEGDTAPGRFVHGYSTGLVHGVRDGEALRPLFGFEVLSGIRVIRQPDGCYRRLCREIVFYRDLHSDRLLDEWDNVYTGERVRVVDIVEPSLSSLENYARTQKPPSPRHT